MICSITKYVMLVLVLLQGCGKESAPQGQGQLPLVSVMTIEAQDAPLTFEYIANTQSSRLVNINSRVNGFLEKRVYIEGSIVKEGDVLFLMDEKPFQAQVNAKKAALAAKKAAMETARLNLARTKPLTKLNALSEKDLDDATGSFETSSAAVQEAQADLDTALLNLSYCTIVSPLDGITSAALVQDGAYINVQNSKLTTVAALDPIWVNFSISENQLLEFRRQVSKGMIVAPSVSEYEVEILLTNGAVFPNRGHITFQEPNFSTETGTFLIRVSVENKDGLLRPNQFVRVKIHGAMRPNAILIPQRAVQQSTKGHYVFVVDKEDKIEMRPVIVGEWQGTNWFIDDGLDPGDALVVDGGLLLQPETKVQTKTYIPK